MSFLSMISQHSFDRNDNAIPCHIPSDSFWSSASEGLQDATTPAFVAASVEQTSSNPTLNASMAVHHAEVAAKHAALLEHWVHYLWESVVQLQSKVTELEDWKRDNLEKVRELRAKQESLKKVLAEGKLDHDVTAYKLKSMVMSPTSFCLSCDHQVSFPPGLEGLSDASGPASGPASSPANSLASPDCLKGSNVEPTPLDFGSVGACDENHVEGVQLSIVNVDGVVFERAEWRIGQLSAKLRSCMGRALVSYPFSAAGMQDIRFMVFADGRHAAKGQKTRTQKALYCRTVTEGPLHGSLKLKVCSSPVDHDLCYHLKVGGHRHGPFKHNFLESTVFGCDAFGIDWLQEVDADGSLTVSVEIPCCLHSDATNPTTESQV